MKSITRTEAISKGIELFNSNFLDSEKMTALDNAVTEVQLTLKCSRPQAVQALALMADCKAAEQAEVAG